MKLTEFVVAKAINPDLKASSKDEAIRGMVAGLKQAGCIAPEHEQNIVAAIMGRLEVGGWRFAVGATIPQIAAAAFVRIRREIGLRPAMSTTEYIIVMSFTSTYGVVFPEAIVDSITFGTPNGSSRIAAVIMVVPPPPPRPRTPVKRCFANSSFVTARAPASIASTA